MMTMFGHYMRTRIFLLILFAIGENNISCLTQKPNIGDEMVLFDFRNESDISNWKEFSDTIWQMGLSKGEFSYFKSGDDYTASFDSILVPQPNGACFCSFRTNTNFNIVRYHFLRFKCLALGDAKVYKIIMGHGDPNHPNILFEQNFEVQIGKFNYIKLSLRRFRPRFGDVKSRQGAVLNLRNITSFAVQVSGGDNIGHTKEKCKSSLGIFPIIVTRS